MPNNAAQPMPNLELVLLDRDGVINFDSKDYITSPEQWQPIPGSLEAIKQLQGHHRVAVCTNQSGVGRGLLTATVLHAIHAKMNQALTAIGGRPIDVFHCPHLPEAGCACRKPAPGLLITAMRAHSVQPSSTLFVGDSTRDLAAAEAAGCQGALVMTGNGATTAAALDAIHPHMVAPDLASLAAGLLNASN